jgi:hypothetical protein
MKWHFYDKNTGAFLGHSFSGPEEFLAANSPANALAIEAAEYDPSLKRLNRDTRQLEDWSPPAVDQEELLRKTRIARARRRIADLESKQARAIREISLGYDGAGERLQSIDDEIASLRTDLNG